jgi:hypothetical protein
MTGHLITICYDDGTGNPVPIYRIPKNVVAYFSPTVKDCFPRLGHPHVHRLGCDGATTVTVSGSVKAAYMLIFQWMVNSCEADKRLPFDHLPFSKYARVYQAAEYLGMDAVQKDMLYRMNKIAEGQVPCEDARTVYAAHPKGSMFREIVVRSIGNAILIRNLRRWKLYIDLRVECADYDLEVTAYVEEKKRELRNAQKAEMAGRKGKKGKKNNRAHGVENAEHLGGTVVEKQVSAPLARKGKGAHPSYYKVELHDFGVSLI